MTSRDEWEQVIHMVVNIFEAQGFVYHIDASSSLFVHGIDFDMDDLDITVKWGTIEQAHKVFTFYNPTELTEEYPPSFKFFVNGHEVHILSYESESGIGEDQDRVRVKIGDILVWSKTVDFYEKHMMINHPLKNLVKSYSRKASL